MPGVGVATGTATADALGLGDQSDSESPGGGKGSPMLSRRMFKQGSLLDTTGVVNVWTHLALLCHM